jgi:hypothetical protein
LGIFPHAVAYSDAAGGHAAVVQQVRGKAVQRITLVSRGLTEATPSAKGLARICARASEAGRIGSAPVAPGNRRREIIGKPPAKR